MKKKLFSILSVILLASCSMSSLEEFKPYYTFTNDGVPTYHASSTGSHITYLMMSKYGRVDGQAGVDVESKFLENCIIYLSEPGAELPAKETVSSTVNNATFRGWFQYNSNVYPEELTVVPQNSGECVYAIFDGPTGGGGSSQGGGGSTTTGQIVTYTVNQLPTWVTDDGCIIFAWYWGGDAGNGAWVKLNYTSTTSATFEAPDNITGFNMARCVAGTVTPNWENRDASNNDPGRIYNKTGDVTVQSGYYMYDSPSWVGYPD